MPNFKVIIRRHVSKLDEFTREIEAENIEAAYAKADDIAADADMNCPDDCDEVLDDLPPRYFYVEEVEEC